MLSVTREFLKFKQHLNLFLKFNPIDVNDPINNYSHLGYPFADTDFDDERTLKLQRTYCYFSDIKDVMETWEFNKKLTNLQLRVLYDALFKPECNAESLHHFTLVFLYVTIVRKILTNHTVRQQPDFARNTIEREVRQLGIICRQNQMLFTQQHLRDQNARNDNQ